MLAADTSTLIAYFGGDGGRDVEMLVEVLGGNGIVLPPVVLCELLSEPALPVHLRTILTDLPLIDLTPDYWARAAASRAKLLSHRLKARLADTLIAQACIDAGVPLIARDRDFRHFARHCGLKLA